MTQRLMYNGCSLEKAVTVLSKTKKTLGSSLLVKIVLLLFIISSVISLTSAKIHLSQKEQELAKLQKQQEELQLTNDQLQSLLSQGSHEDLMERALRENGYVRTDEKVYTDGN